MKREHFPLNDDKTPEQSGNLIPSRGWAIEN